MLAAELPRRADLVAECVRLLERAAADGHRQLKASEAIVVDRRKANVTPAFVVRDLLLVKRLPPA
jgi:hypothetical protein